jgi:hypothetical protein
MEASIRHDRTPPARAPESPEFEPARSRGWEIFDTASTIGFIALWLGFARHFTAESGLLETTLLLLLFALPAFTAADLGAGLLHWFADTFFAPSTPVIGSSLILAFREHHRDPRGIARRGIIEASGLNCFACIVILSVALVFDASTPAGQAGGIALLWFTLAIALTNLFHRWAHSERVARPVAWLQRKRWILSPERHALHHSGAHERSFCVTTGWLNPLFDRIRFFQRLEFAVRWLTRSGVRSKLAKGSRAN